MTAGAGGPRLPSVAQLVREFLPLNRRRRHEQPPLSVSELRRWEELRTLLERGLGIVPPPEAEARRRSLRVPARLSLRFTSGLTPGTGTTLDLSEGGVRFEAERPPALRAPLQLEIEPERSRSPLLLAGVVCWARSEAGALPQVGIRFENLEPDQERALATRIENLLARL